MSNKPTYTIELFTEDPEVWNILDPSGKVCGQQDSKDDAEGAAMVYQSNFDDGVEYAQKELASLKSELEDYKMLVRAVTQQNAAIVYSRFHLCWIIEGDGFSLPLTVVNGLPIFTPALRSALKAAVEGRKA